MAGECRLTAITMSQSARLMAVAGPVMEVPALLTRRSRPSKASHAAWASGGTASGSARSAGTQTVVGAVRRLEPPGQRVERRGVAAGGHDPGTLGREALADGQADALARTGHQGPDPVQVPRHVRRPFPSCRLPAISREVVALSVTSVLM